MFVDRTEGSAVKLTDFGLAAMFAEGGPPLTEVLGSAYYVAPEVLREAYSKEADIWSTGVVLFIALGGYAPFDGANEREVSSGPVTRLLRPAAPASVAAPPCHVITAPLRRVAHPYALPARRCSSRFCTSRFSSRTRPGRTSPWTPRTSSRAC